MRTGAVDRWDGMATRLQEVARAARAGLGARPEPRPVFRPEEAESNGNASSELTLKSMTKKIHRRPEASFHTQTLFCL